MAWLQAESFFHAHVSGDRDVASHSSSLVVWRRGDVDDATTSCAVVPWAWLSVGVVMWAAVLVLLHRVYRVLVGDGLAVDAAIVSGHAKQW